MFIRSTNFASSTAIHNAWCDQSNDATHSEEHLVCIIIQTLEATKESNMRVFDTLQRTYIELTILWMQSILSHV